MQPSHTVGCRVCRCESAKNPKNRSGALARTFFRTEHPFAERESNIPRCTYWGHLRVLKYRGIGMLELQPDMEQFYRGREFRALKTNANKVKNQPLTLVDVTAVVDEDLVRKFCKPTVSGLPIGIGTWRLDDSGMRCYVLMDADGDPIVLTLLRMTDDGAFLLQHGARRRGSYRWYNFYLLAQELAQLGVARVFTDSLVFNSAGSQYFARCLGFQLVTLRCEHSRDQRGSARVRNSNLGNLSVTD